jgi:large subunit ribosomal protein L33
MAKKGDKRKIIGMVSEETHERIYYSTKNTMNTPDRLQLRKYSPKLRKHVLFVETKKSLGRNEVIKKKH